MKAQNIINRLKRELKENENAEKEYYNKYKNAINAYKDDGGKCSDIEVAYNVWLRYHTRRTFIENFLEEIDKEED